MSEIFLNAFLTSSRVQSNRRFSFSKGLSLKAHRILQVISIVLTQHANYATASAAPVFLLPTC
jgi:hypothetical protein